MSEIVETVLILFFLWGVIILIKDYFQFLHKKKSVQSQIAELNSSMSDFQESTLKTMTGYENALLNLQKQSEQLEKDCSDALQAADQDVGKILNIAEGLIDLNDNLFEKVSCIDNCLMNDETLSQRAVDQFKEIIKDDISKQKEYQTRVSQYRQEREQRIQHRLLRHEFPDLER